MRTWPAGSYTRPAVGSATGGSSRSSAPLGECVVPGVADRAHREVDAGLLCVGAVDQAGVFASRGVNAPRRRRRHRREP